MSMLFSRKDKPASITIETGQELKHMFDSRVISVDLNRSVTETIILLLANHEIGMINESEYGLYAKESSHTMHRLDSSKTLRENRVRNKDVIVLRKGIVAQEIRTSPRGQSVHQLSFRERVSAHADGLPKLMRHNSSTSKLAGPHLPPPRDNFHLSPPTTAAQLNNNSPTPPPQSTVPVLSSASSPMTRNPSATFSPSGNRLMHRISRTFSSSKTFADLTGEHRKIIFGSSIRSSLNENDRIPIPAAIQGLLNYIEENMLDIPKVFIQKSDATGETEKLRRCLEEGVMVDLHKFSPHVISNLVLQYIDLLQEPLIDNNTYKEILSVEPGMIWRITILLAKLREEHFFLLKRTLGVMRAILDNGSKNGVTVDSLAAVIAPIIMHPQNSNSSPDFISTIARTKDLAKIMLENYNTIFADSASDNVPNMAPGEKLDYQLDDVNCAHMTGWDSSMLFSRGLMWVTNYQLIWKSTERESMGAALWTDVRIPFRSILYVERYKHPVVGKVNKEVYAGLHVICRNFRFETFVFSSRKDSKRVLRSLRHIFEEAEHRPFAFDNSETFIGGFNGWKVYNCLEEFKRMGLNKDWRVSEINKKYDFCEIYPKHLIVPAYITDDILRASAANREHNRIPILVWKHPVNHSVLLRSGPTLNHSTNVESMNMRDVDLSGNQLIEGVLINILKSRQGNPDLANIQSSIEIADMGTPPSHAYYHYQSIQSIWFSDTPAPSKVQDSLQTLLEVIVKTPHNKDKWVSQVEVSKYTNHLRNYIYSARKIASLLQSGVSVLSQGTLENGRDLIECAMLSLALIMVDPFFRTIEGFMVLIEKEWCSFAFPFYARKKAPELPSENIMRADIMPTFVLFLDCVWQIYKDVPDAFEYNNRLLVFLADQAFCGRFGTFLNGIDRELLLQPTTEPGKISKTRVNNRRAAKKKTVSVWNYINYHSEQFANYLFTPNPGILLPDTRPFSFKLWQAYFLRFAVSTNGTEFTKRVQNARLSPGDTTLHLQQLNLPCIPLLEDNVPIFRHLSHIQVLDLSGNCLNVFPSDLLYLNRLRKLNLSKNRLRKFPTATFIKHWANSLEELVLNDNSITLLPPSDQLQQLSSLTVLRMASNMLTDVLSVGSLTTLKTLDLSSNNIVTLPKDIAFLRHVQELSLSKNDIKSLPDSLSGLCMLKNLSLSQNKFSDFPSGIFELLHLEILDISDNFIDTIGDGVSRLQNLRICNLSNNKLRLLSPFIYHLGALLELNLARNHLTSIHSDVSHLSSLLRLNLESNIICDIPIEISGLCTLTELNLSQNALIELTPAIGQLSSLLKLDLLGNKIASLPQTLGSLSKTLRFLHLDVDHVTNISQEILQRGSEAILSHLGQEMQTEKPAYRIKLMVIGKDNVGKTALSNCLRKKHKKYADNCNTLSTDGIDIDTWTFTVETDGEKQKVEVNMWDMAGQEVYYTTHQFFLSEATIYVVVWNVMPDENNNNGEDKIEYWIRTLKARCGDTLPPAVFVVGTHLDDPSVSKDLEKNLLNMQRGKYKGIFPQLEIYFRAVSCSTGEGIDTLRKEIQTVALKQKTMGKSKPSAWFLLEKCLMRERDKRQPPIMQSEEIKLLGQACGIKEVATLHQALSWLHDTGYIILFNPDGGSFSTSDKGIVILDPRWLSNTFTTIFTTRHQWARGGGMLYDDLQHIWKPPAYPHNLHRSLLSLAEKFEIVFLLDKRHALPIYDETKKWVKLGGKKHSTGSMASILEDESPGEPASPLLTSLTPSPSPNPSPSLSRSHSSSSPSTDAEEQLVIIVPSLLPSDKPLNLLSLWPVAPKITDAQLGRRYQLEFIPIGLFSRVMVRCLRLCKAKICWRDGILLESNETTSTGESRERILVEVFMHRRCIDVTGRAVSDGTTVDFSLSRAILECVETLVKDYFKLPVLISIPCIHCIMMTAPTIESPAVTPSYSNLDQFYDRSRKRTMSTPVSPTTIRPTRIPYYFALEKCENAVVEGLTYINCNKNNTETPVRLSLLAPDLTMADFFGRRIEFCDIVLGKKIGEGGSASVFKGDWNGKQVAVKKLKQVSGMDSTGMRVDTMDIDSFSQTFQEFRREAYIMSGLSHPHLVQFEGLCLSPLCIIMEFMPGGNLFELLHSEEEITWRMKIKIAIDIATGMAYLHRGGIIHRDLKSPNVMMIGKKDAIVAKVTDFGLSGLSTVMSGRAVINPVWLAPEVLTNSETPDPSKIDVYSFGVIMYEIITRKEFFGNESFLTLLEEKVIKGERPPLPGDCPTVVVKLINACWDNDPNKRPTFSKICDELTDIKHTLKRDGMIGHLERKQETQEGETPTGEEEDSMADSSDEEKRVRRTKSDGDVTKMDK